MNTEPEKETKVIASLDIKVSTTLSPYPIVVIVNI